MWKADCFEESIPVFFAAASLFKKEGDLMGMGRCVVGFVWGGMRVANKRMIEHDVTMKEVVKRHVIPLMHDVKNQMLEMTSVSDKDKCDCMSLVLEYIARSEELVGDDVAANKTWEESRLWEVEEESESSEMEEEPGTYLMQ